MKERTEEESRSKTQGGAFGEVAGEQHKSLLLLLFLIKLYVRTLKDMQSNQHAEIENMISQRERSYHILCRSVHHLPDKEAEHADESIHEADVVADAGCDWLLAVWTNRLHWSRLKHLPLQNSHGGGGPRRGENCGCVTWTEVTGPRTIVLHYRMRKVPRGSVVTTCSTSTERLKFKSSHHLLTIIPSPIVSDCFFLQSNANKHLQENNPCL